MGHIAYKPTVILSDCSLFYQVLIVHYLARSNVCYSRTIESTSI